MAVAPHAESAGNMPNAARRAVAPVAVVPAEAPAVLGRGSYGCVVKPAFSNVDETGRIQHFPNNVTKIYSDRDEAGKAEHNSNVLRALNRRANVPMRRYQKSFTRRNIPEPLRRKCGVRAGNNLTERIYPVRMPYLGISFADAIKHHKDDIQALDPRVIFRSIRELFEIVAVYRRGEFIHGDIRQPNVTIMPSGVMHIIDFDWFYKQDAFVQRYTGPGFYSNPVETGLWQEWFFRPGQPTAADLNGFAERYIDTYNGSFASPSYPEWLTKKDVLATALRDIHTRFKDTHKDKSSRDQFRLFRTMSIDTFDSFGFAMTLIYFLDGYLPGWGKRDRSELTEYAKDVLSAEDVPRFVELMYRLYNEVFVQMVHWNPVTRMRIDAAITKLDELLPEIDRIMASVHGGRRRTRRRR
jgi:hypothetical protein